MNHFTQKYFHNIAGAGGGPKKPDPPPPPVLNPPKLGDLQAIASFEYLESVDLISDGSIEGLVSQDGSYVENDRIFESIYLNDVPIKQSSIINDDSLFTKYYVTGISGIFSNFFYQNGEFQEKTIDECVQNISGSMPLKKIISLEGGITIDTYDSSVNYSIIDGKDAIAASIYNSIMDVPSTSAAVSANVRLPNIRVLDSYYKILKFGKFNYNSALEVSTYLLPDFPDKFKDEYPFVCLKLDFDLRPSVITYDGTTYIASYTFEASDYLSLDSDIYNQTFLPLEATELNKKRFLESRKKIDLTYPVGDGWAGSIYLFLYKNEGKILKNSIDAVINNLKYINIIKPKYKYNIANANCEIRDGSELQKSLSLFNKTYLDKAYSFKLFGPFGKQRPVLTLFTKDASTSNAKEVNTKFDPKSQLAISGVSQDIRDSAASVITFSEYKNFVQKNSIYKAGNKTEWDGEFGNTIGAAVSSIVEAIVNKTSLYSAIKEYSLNGSILKVTLAGRIGNHTRDRTKYLYTDEELIFAINLTTSLFVQVDNEVTPKNYPATMIIRRYVWNKNTKAYEWVAYNINAFKPSALVNGVKLRSDCIFNENQDGIRSAAKSYYVREGTIMYYGFPQGFEEERTDKYGYEYTVKYNIARDDEYFITVGCILNLLVGSEGSLDNRVNQSNTFKTYSDWANNTIAYQEETAKPLVHIVNNPNVNKVFITMGLRVLRDTAHRSDTILLKTNSKENEKVDIGSAIPSVIRFKIECGYQDKDGNEIIDFQNYPRIYEIKGIADSPATIDIGREENNSSLIIPKYSRFIVGTKSIAEPIELPPATENKIRFVRVSRITYESFSSLIKREIYVEKITEIIDYPFSYPFSSVCGLKLDARSSSEIPSRSYDARFKKVFIPSNYFPLRGDGKDKRYLTAAEFTNATTEEKRIYQGNWDGTFKFAWTDNPVWILFDLLINRRYGLGNFIEPTQVNYWELYKIGRYCDAVDDDGIFQGVPAADGGYEPRYAFNGVIGDKTNIFDMLKTIVSSFRGNLFYSNSEINFTNDRLKPIMSLFNNSNVKDGIFSYTNDRRDLQYNVIEVSFLDRNDLYKEKIEYVEDPDDIKNRGILRTSAQTFGVTSRAHAKRIGQHIIYSTINEDQNIQFVAGLDTLLCRPGDLIAVNDELRSFKKHVGRVLNVDLGANSIYTNISLQSSDFSSSGVTGEITVLIPTGKVSTSEFYDLSQSPSKLNIGELYKNDIPMSVTLKASTTGLGGYGSTFVIDTGCSGITLLKNIKLGAPCSITLSNTKQEIYKIAAIKELNLNEYEVTATKFDTGKFAEIESNNNLNDFFSYFPASRTGLVSEGQSNTIQNQFVYQLNYPEITSFNYGNYDAQNDYVDISGSWNPVAGSNCYDVELITPKYKSIKERITGTNIIFYDQSEVGQFLLKVTARETGVYPNPISPTAISGFKVVSYTAPVRTNAIVKNFKINKNI